MTENPLLGDDALISASTARKLAGDVSAMTLWRWQQAGVIPAPIQIRRRNYWSRDRFLGALARAAKTPM